MDAGLAIAAAVAALFVLLLLRSLLVVDQTVFGWAQSFSGASTKRAVVAVGTAIPYVLAGFIFLLVGRNRWRGVLLLPRLALIAAGGALLAEVLKTGIDRLRPSAPLGALAGNSLPSGHVMSTTAAALAIALLAREVESSKNARTIVYVGTGCVVLAQIACRIYVGAHWMSDCTISVLLGVAWTLGLVAILGRSPTPIRRAVVANVALATALLGLMWMSTLRLHLPSARGRMSRHVMPALSVKELPDPALHARPGS